MVLIDAKFQPWATVKEQLQTILQTADPQDVCVTIPYGLQLLHTMHHPHVVRCLAFYHSTAGDIYVTLIDTGACNEIYVWTVSSLDENVVKCAKFPIKAAISRLIFIPHHRVFVGFCTDMTLRTFSDLIHNCAELTQVTCLSTVLCMAYNECTDELITGGHGCLQTWKMTHIELRDPLTPGRPIECQITSDDWVRDLQIDKRLRQLVVLCDEGVHIIDYQTNKQIFFIRNWHETALTSCVFYRRLEYFITAAMDGSIKVWNAVVYSQVHEFIGHYDCVTGLVMHPSDPLLISSSKDGTIRVWRLDTFELTQRLDVGEKILGMRLANVNQVYYYTLHDVKIYTFNQFHHMFTPVRSCIHKLACVKTATSPTRILCAAEDGGVRLISAVSGTILTIIYPMATYQILTDLVYDPKHDMIYTVMATGDVLVFNSATNPCTADQLWVPGLPDESVLCLALFKLDCGLGQRESATCESLIFAGLNSGQIILLEAQQHFMKTLVKAHLGQVSALECSHGQYEGGCESIGTADRLMSCGSDKVVRVWAVELTGPKSLQVKLTCRKMITCSLCPSLISMLGYSLCMVLPNNVIHVYELLDELETNDAVIGDENCNSSKMLQRTRLHTHLKEHEHTKMVTALCSCQSLGLFATTSNDGLVKLWDLTNTLVRELCFDASLRSVCFANERGDLLVGFQNHVSYITVSTYLPLYYMEKLLDGMNFKDEEVEEPIRFNPDLQLWFNIANLPTFPTDAVLRRHIQQSADHLQRHRLSIAPPRDRGDSEAISSPVVASSLSPVEYESSSPTLSFDELDKLSHAKPRVRFGSLRPPLGEPVAKKQQEGDELDSEKPKESQIQDEIEAEEPTQVKVEEAAGDREDVMEGEEEAELKGLSEEEEEEDYNPWPIAPDGYIPNSVIRSIMGYRHTLEPIPESPWKLQPVPSGFKAVKTPVESESYEHHEPFIWAPSSSEEEEEFDLLSLEDLPDEACKSRIFQELGVANMSVTERRKTLEKLQLSGMALPGKVSIPQLEALGVKAKGKGAKRRKSRGINAVETAVVRQKLRTSGMKMELEESEDEEEELVMEYTTPELLRHIAANSWFPRGVTLKVEPVVRTLLDLLDDVADLQYRPVCEAVVQIYKELGIGDHLMETVLRAYRDQLKSSRAIVRANAVKTLTAFGLDRRDVILSLLPALTDEMADVRDETMKAVDVLAGIHDRSSLMGYLEKIGFLKPYQGQEEVIQDLARRYTPDLSHRPALHPSHIQLVARRRPGTLPEERLPSPLEGMPCVSPVLNVHNWLSQYQMELGQRPSGEDIFLGNDFDTEPPTYEAVEPWREKISSVQRKYVPFASQGQRRTSQPPTGRRRASMRYPASGKPMPLRTDQQLTLDRRTTSGGYPLASMGQQVAGGTFKRVVTPTKQRKTMHIEILQAHEESMGAEKAKMENQMQLRLRHHRDRYEKLMQRQQQEKHQQPVLVPTKAGLYSYYSKRAQLEASTKDSELYETDVSEWSETALARAKAVIAAFAEMPSQPCKKPRDWEFPSESGVGGSSLLGSSGPQGCPAPNKEPAGGEAADGSSGFFTETDLLGQGSLPGRPRSKLTVENLQRHDALSGKAKVLMDDGTLSTRTIICRQIQKDWRDFFRLPSVQRRKKERAAVLAKRKPAPDLQPIKCISSGVKVDRSRGERGQRLLEEVAVDGRQRGNKGKGPGEVIYSPVPEKLTMNTKNRSTGVSHYGTLDMMWTIDGPIIAEAGEGHHKVVSMTAIHSKPGPAKESHKQCLRQQMLFPSLYNMSVLDENRKRHAAVARAKENSPHFPDLKPLPPASEKVTYRWETPEPVVCTKELKKRASLLQTVNESRVTEVAKEQRGQEREPGNRTTHVYLPFLSLDVPETPVVPQNSVISHQGSVRLPKIPTAGAAAGNKSMMEDIQEQIEDKPRSTITIPLQ
ncbi:uncharacterized protein LOC110989469 isoform X2 [Acanthaster planci]|uniref:Uncharacterized protein LOC110989469 isoform X2 n=1 Tax=Acanthaster planci TaxID=133434 RepID=A0A8B8A151_ACAPL|nr:uncharacterized protein LOC110989469 isoform X2 [Acanthaster planci]